MLPTRGALGESGQASSLYRRCSVVRCSQASWMSLMGRSACGQQQQARQAHVRVRAGAG